MRESIASTLIWGFIACGVGIAIAIVLSGCAKCPPGHWTCGFN